MILEGSILRVIVFHVYRFLVHYSLSLYSIACTSRGAHVWKGLVCLLHIFILTSNISVQHLLYVTLISDPGAFTPHTDLYCSLMPRVY